MKEKKYNLEQKHNHKKIQLNSMFNFNEKNIHSIFISLGIILIIITIFNMIQISPLNDIMKEKIGNARELAKPANLELITITDSKCNDCSTITELVDSIKSSNTKIIKEQNLDLQSKNARDLINKYNLQKIPTVILKGEIEKFNTNELERKDDTLIYSDVKTPYTDAITGKVIGKVSIILIKDSSCKNCFDLSNVFNILKQQNVFLKNEDVLDKVNPKAEKLISQFNLKKLPAVLISEDIEAYSFAKNLRESGIIKKEGFYVVESPPPYFDLGSKKIRGLVSLIMVTDDYCDDCYDVNLHKSLLSQMGIAIGDEKTIDLNSVEGMKLKTKYHLQQVPTIILEGDLGIYEGLESFWKENMGSVENDGSFVFRKVASMNLPFNDLTTEGG